MPPERSSNLSEESLVALLDALGFKELENPREELNSCPLNEFEENFDISHHPPMQSFKLGSKSSAPGGSLIFEHEYLADYDFGSDFDEDGSEGDSDDTLHSRPCSIIFGFDAVDPTLLSPTVSPTVSPNGTRRQSALMGRTRPLGRYFPDGLPPLDHDCSTPSTSSFQSPSERDAAHPSERDDRVYIKAAFNTTIIMIRVSRSISFIDLKQKLYNKFVQQEGIRISRFFSVVNVLPPWSFNSDYAADPFSRIGISHSRPGSAPFPSGSTTKLSLEPRRASFAERTKMQTIDSEADWKRLLSGHGEGSKVTLRILNSFM